MCRPRCASWTLERNGERGGGDSYREWGKKWYMCRQADRQTDREAGRQARNSQRDEMVSQTDTHIQVGGAPRLLTLFSGVFHASFWGVELSGAVCPSS